MAVFLYRDNGAEFLNAVAFGFVHKLKPATIKAFTAGVRMFDTEQAGGGILAGIRCVKSGVPGPYEVR
jgi:hypothetical protein